MPSQHGTDRPTTPLLIRFGRLGDMVLQQPLLHLLHRRYGMPCRILSRGPWTRSLYATDPDVGDIHQLLARNNVIAFSPERWRAIAMLHRHTGPIYVSEDIRGSLKRIRNLLDFARVPRERCVFLDAGDAGEHWIDRNLRLGQRTPPAFDVAAYPWREEDLQHAARLHLAAEDRADLERWLDARGLRDAPLVLLQPGNWKLPRSRFRHSDDPKSWPPEHWLALLRAMRVDLPQAQLLLCGSSAEHAYLAAIARAANLPNLHLATHDLPVRRLAALLERAHSMVSVDTGPAHIAAAMGCPLVVLYGGAYDPRTWDRRSALGRPVINLGSPPHPVAAIAPEQVIAAWRSLAS